MELHIPLVYAFIAFTLFCGLIAYFCWRVIRHHWQKILHTEQSGPEHFRSVFTVVVMWIPLLGFTFQFVYFLVKTLQELITPSR